MEVVIIDDERKARNVLKILLKENCPSVTKIYEAEDLLSGTELIKIRLPRIVFLDIEMPEHSGLEIFNFIDNKTYNFEIIFTTAYSEFAIQAFQMSAIDYLLKPIKSANLKESVEKVVALVGNSKINTNLDALKESLSIGQINKIGLPFSGGVKFANLNEIVLFEADAMYTKVHLVDEVMLVSKPLKYFTELLKDYSVFYKPHRSFLINLKYVKEYIRKDGGYINMDNGQTVSISKDKKEEFLRIVQSIGQ